MVTAIIVAAGISRRMGFDKLFAPLAGKPVVLHSLLAFQNCAAIDEIVVVARPEKTAELEELVATEKLTKVSKITPGGADRHESVWKGLQSVDAKKTKFLAIHDGARPLTTPKLIEECVALARVEGAACCSSPIPDTVKRASSEHVVTESVERSGLWAMQTPQVFSSGLILQAYASVIANHETVTDEVSAVQKLGKKIALLRNHDWNFKITFPHDIELAEHVLAVRNRERLGKP